MKYVTVCLLLAAVAAANPIMVRILSEFQVAPDSLEGIELHGWNYWVGSLAGWRVVTPAGVAVIDDGIGINGPDDWVVIDRSNTTGTFSLPDSAGFIALVPPSGDTFEKVTWPGDAGLNTDEAWTPPEGMSCAMDYWTYGWPDPVECFDWYVDRTPTFGAPNDDDSARIYGTVSGPGGVPLPGAMVRISGPEGRETGWAKWPGGDFELRPGFGTFLLSASKDGYLPDVWPESIAVEVNEVVGGINVILVPVGIAEPVPAEPGFRWARDRLVLDLERDAVIRLSVFDPAGRGEFNRRLFLRAGHSRLALPGLRPGVHLVRLDFEDRAITGKLVVPRGGR
ncbi:MAG: carboxypeptidase-like regulatory domain-containing protein [bacterium]